MNPKLTRLGAIAGIACLAFLAWSRPIPGGVRTVKRQAITHRITLPLASLSALVLLAMAAIAPSAGAIVNGQPAGDGYGAVGVVVFQPTGGDPADMCSGFLISPTAFVTAGHCALEALAKQEQIGGDIGVSFDPVFDPATSGVVHVTNVTVHPDYLANQESLRAPDMAVLTLARQVAVDPIHLPEQGAANRLAAGTELTTVGYGLTQDCETDLGHCVAVYDPMRRFASERLLSVSQPFITVGQNPNAHGEGGVCYGDSGGPHLIPGTLTAVAITADINSALCWSTTFDIRLDTTAALEFLGPYTR
jgi:hypothetical protein